MDWIWKSSIAKSLFITFIFVLIPITIIGFSVNYSSMKVATNEITASYYNSISFMTNTLNDNLDHFENIAKLICSDEDIAALNQSPDGKMLWEYKYIGERLRFSFNKNIIDGEVRVYLLKKKKMLSSMFTDFYKDCSDEEIDYLKSYDIIANPKWSFEVNKDNKLLELTHVYRSIYDYNALGTAATIKIPQKQLDSLLSDLVVMEGGSIFLVDSNDTFYSPNTIEEHIYEELKLNLDRSNENNTPVIKDSNGQDFLLIYKNIAATDLTMGMLLPQKEVIRPITKIQIWLYFLIIISLILAFMFSIITYRKLLLPLHKLIDGMKQVSKGDFTTLIEEEQKEEFGFMFKQFNKMVQKIDQLVNDIYTVRIQKHKSDLKLLQSQINPHFLYNCLNYIYQESMVENNESTAEMAIYLSRYFRFAFHLNNDITTIENEVNNIKTYIRIQTIRYPNKIMLTTNLDPATLSTKIPHLSIQPIVENAILHSMEQTGEVVHINIYSKVEHDGTHIFVENDGQSMSDEKLLMLNNSLDEIDIESSDSGLKNTHIRLNLEYGENAGLHIYNRKPNGTIVEIYLPNIGGENV